MKRRREREKRERQRERDKERERERERERETKRHLQTRRTPSSFFRTTHVATSENVPERPTHVANKHSKKNTHVHAYQVHIHTLLSPLTPLSSPFPNTWQKSSRQTYTQTHTSNEPSRPAHPCSWAPTPTTPTPFVMEEDEEQSRLKPQTPGAGTRSS